MTSPLRRKPRITAHGTSWRARMAASLLGLGVLGGAAAAQPPALPAPPPPAPLSVDDYPAPPSSFAKLPVLPEIKTGTKAPAPPLKLDLGAPPAPPEPVGLTRPEPPASAHQ